jgi:NADH-quinone oxidoreductase subunit L
MYVWATLLPLASFAVLLLAGMLRAFARPYRETRVGRICWRILGGDAPGRVPAYLATFAIAAAFVLTLVGFVWFAVDHWTPARTAASINRWESRTVWAQVGWMQSDLLRPASKIELGYKIDNLTTAMFLMVTFIATLIHVYSIAYMAPEMSPYVEDERVASGPGHLKRRGRFGRFFLFLSLFCFAMLNLVLADNFFQVFFSWELVGLCSYFLIGFDYERPSAAAAAMKAFVVNRIGDAGFLVGLAILWAYVGTFNFEDSFRRVRAPLTDKEHGGQFVVNNDQLQLFPIAPQPKAPDQAMPYWLLGVAGLGLFLGCIGKSAQFPLHVWLPDAMEGPTPVSALIHAATMVAAGVYLAARCYPLFTPEVRLVIAYIGAITLFLGAAVCVTMTDIKRLLAWSTVSQLGYMMLALGVGGWAVALFHLITHAFIKGLLFLGAGSIIHGCRDEQDLSKMGGLVRKMPVTAFTMFAGVLALAGTPLFSGWYSKDGIIAHAYGFFIVHRDHWLLFVLPLLTAALTSLAMFRMWFLAFLGKPRDSHIFEHAHESPQLMTAPLVLLAGASVIIGWGWPVWDTQASALQAHIQQAQPSSVVADFGLALGADPAWKGYKEPLAEEVSEHRWAQKIHHDGGLYAVIAGFLGLSVATVVYVFRTPDLAAGVRRFPGLFDLLRNGGYLDDIYETLVVLPTLGAAAWCQWFDTEVIDGFLNRLGRWTVTVARWDGRFDRYVVDGLVNLTARGIYRGAAKLRWLQSGSLRQYVLFMVLGILGLFAVVSYCVARVSAG